MTTSRLLPRTAFVLAALLASGCAHKAATYDAPPTITVVEAPISDANANGNATADKANAASATTAVKAEGKADVKAATVK